MIHIPFVVNIYAQKPIVAGYYEQRVSKPSFEILQLRWYKADLGQIAS